MPSYYEVLGVAPDADQSRIRDAYARAVRAAPPAEAGAEVRDRRLDEAYAVVGDPDRRRRYDALRLSEGSGGNAELLSLLSVIADLGAIPTADEVLGRPGDFPPADPATGGLRVVGPTGPHPSSRAGGTTGGTSGGPPRGAPARAGRAAAPPRRPGAASSPQPQPQRKVPGTDGDVEQLGRRRTLVGVVLAGILVGVGGGALYAGQRTPELALEEGACVTLGESEAAVARCDDPAAGARIVQIVDDAAECPPSPLGSLSLPDGTACLAEIEPAGG